MRFILLFFFGVVQSVNVDMNGIPFNLPGFKYCSSCNITTISTIQKPVNKLDAGCKNYNLYLKQGYDEYKMLKGLLQDVWDDQSNKDLNMYWLFYSAARAKIIFESTYLRKYSLRLFIKHNPLPTAENCLSIYTEGVGFEDFKHKRVDANFWRWRLDTVDQGRTFEEFWTQGIESLWAAQLCNSTFHRDFVQKSYNYLERMNDKNKKMREDTLWQDYWHYWTKKSYWGHAETTDIMKTSLPTCDADEQNNNIKLLEEKQNTNLIRPVHQTTPRPSDRVVEPEDESPTSSTKVGATSTIISPWGDDCHIIINEVSPYLTNVVNRREFIELKRVCQSTKKDDKKAKKGLQRVKIAVVNLKTKEMVTSISLQGFSFSENDFFTIYGNENFVRVSKFETDNHIFLPRGTEEPHLVLLLYKKDKDPNLQSEVYTAASLSRKSLKPRDIFRSFDVKVKNEIITYRLAEVFKHTVIDAVAYGGPINEDFSYLHSGISSVFVGCNFILYDYDQSKINEQYFSINQCQLENLKRPFQFASFKRGKPTPGDENDCSNQEYVLDVTRHATDVETVGLTESPSWSGECPFSDPTASEIFWEIKTEENYINKYLNPNYGTKLEHILDYSKTVWKYIKENNVDLEKCTLRDRLFPYEVMLTSTVPVERKLICKICNTRLHKCPKTLAKNRIDDKMRDAGFYVTNTDHFRKGLNDHIRKIQHLESLLQSVRKDRIILQAQQNIENIKHELPDRLKALTNLIRAVYTLTLSNTTPYSFSKIIDLLRLTEAKIGHHMQSKDTAMRIMKFISDAMHQTLIDFLVKSKPPVSILLDGSSDKQNHHYVLVYFQTTEGSRTIVYFYRMLTMGKSSTASAYLTELTNAFKADGIPFSDYIREKATSVITDGAANMRSFQTLFSNWVGRFGADGNLKPLYGIFCTAHKLQLISRNSVIPGKADADLGPNKEILYLGQFESKLNEFYSFFKSASRRIGEFREVHVQFNFPRIELTYLYANRWISAEYKTIKNFLGAYKTLEKTLQVITDNKAKEYNIHVQNKATSLRKELLDKRFLLLLQFMQDYTSVFQEWSLGLQTRAGLLVSQYEPMIKLKKQLKHLAQFKGEYLEAFLKNVDCSSKPNEDTDSCTLEEYENSDSIKWNDLTFTTNKDDNTMVDFKTLVEVLIKKTENKLNFYLPQDEITTLRIFNPNKFPASIEALKLHKKISTPVGEEIYVYGEKEILDLCSVIGIENKQLVVQHWGKLVKSIILSPNWDLYRSTPDVARFWSLLLNDKNLKWEPETENLIRTVLTLANGSIVCETGFSLFNVIKNQRRTRLTDKNLEAFLRLASNGPRSLELFDASRYARLWVDHGGNLPDTEPSFSKKNSASPGDKADSFEFCDEPDAFDVNLDIEISDEINQSLPSDTPDAEIGSVDDISLGSETGRFMDLGEEDRESFGKSSDSEGEIEGKSKTPLFFRSFLY